MSAPHRSHELCDRQPRNMIDTQGAKLHLALALLPLVCIACKWPWQECRAVVFWLSAHASLSVLNGAWSYYYDEFYCRHRSAIIVALQSLQLATLSKIVPAAMAMAFGSQVAAGKAPHFTIALLMCGLGSYSVATHCLVARLPWRLAAWFTVIRVLVTTCAFLPQQAHYLRVLEVRDVAMAIKGSVDTVYNTVMSLTALTILEAAAAPSCFLLSLALWVHLCLAGLFPLYILYVMDHSCSRAATSGAASNGSSRSSSRAASHQSLQSLSYQLDEHSQLQLASTVVHHCAILFGGSMLLWALVDCLVVLLENPAKHYGVCA